MRGTGSCTDQKWNLNFPGSRQDSDTGSQWTSHDWLKVALGHSRPQKVKPVYGQSASFNTPVTVAALRWQSAVPTGRKPLVQSPLPHRLSMAVHICNLSNQKVEAGGSAVQYYPQLHAKFETSLGCKKPSSKTNKSLHSPQLLVFFLSLIQMKDRIYQKE